MKNNNKKPHTIKKPQKAKTKQNKPKTKKKKQPNKNVLKYASKANSDKVKKYIRLGL